MWNWQSLSCSIVDIIKELYTRLSISESFSTGSFFSRMLNASAMHLSCTTHEPAIHIQRPHYYHLLRSLGHSKETTSTLYAFCSLVLFFNVVFANDSQENLI